MNEKKENFEYCKRVCEELETAEDLIDYINEQALDTVYIINQDKSYKAVRVAVTLGGPNVYLDTEKGAVCLYWWGEEAQYPMKPETIEQIDAIFEEIWNA